MTILPAGPIPTRLSGSTNDLSGLTPKLKPSEVHILNKAHKHLGFKVGPQGKNGLTTFAWQRGYGAFAVCSSKLDVVRRYIVKQKEHHKVVSFKEELELFMREYNLADYDETYFWR